MDKENSKLYSTALEDERQRMQMTMKIAIRNEDTVGEIPSMRGVRRMKSSNPNVSRVHSGSLQRSNLEVPSSSFRNSSQTPNAARPSAPTKSTDAAASLRGSAVARANSSRNLLRATSSSGLRAGIPARTSSSQGLRPFNRGDPLVNGSIGRKPPNDGLLNMHIRGPGGTLQRNESEMSLGEFSISDGSFFTTDSVNIRKAQLVADPLDHAGSYDEYGLDEDSFADHESFMTRESDAHIFYEVPSAQAAAAPTTAPPMTLHDLAALKMNRLHISHPSTDDISLVSYGTMASGLTTDYTDHDYSEFACDEAEYAE
jgi:hypothetical protein